MGYVMELPDEILLSIVASLPLPTLINFGLACQRFKNISISRRVRQKREIVEKFSIFRRDALSPWPWHRLLLLILTHQIPASYILELQCDDDPSIDHKFSRSSSERAAGDVVSSRNGRKAAAEYDSLIRKAVCDSPWFLPAEQEECIHEIICGNEEATMALLLPLLTGVRLLMPPFYSDRPREVFRRIAEAYRTRELPLPFSRLLIIFTTSFNGEYAWPLEEIPKFIGFPSLKRLVLSHPFDQSFAGWPKDLPNPTCSQVYFDGGSVSLEALRSFADSWNSPCVIKQQFSNPAIVACDGAQEPEWDICLVEGDLSPDQQTFQTGTKTVTVTLQHEGNIWPDKAPWDSFGSEDAEHLGLYDWRSLLD